MWVLALFACFVFSFSKILSDSCLDASPLILTALFRSSVGKKEITRRTDRCRSEGKRTSSGRVKLRS